MSLIVVQNLRKSYGARVVLDGISFEVERGETFGLIGPTGVRQDHNARDS